MNTPLKPIHNEPTVLGLGVVLSILAILGGMVFICIAGLTAIGHLLGG